MTKLEADTKSMCRSKDRAYSFQHSFVFSTFQLKAYTDCCSPDPFSLVCFALLSKRLASLASRCASWERCVFENLDVTTWDKAFCAYWEACSCTCGLHCNRRGPLASSRSTSYQCVTLAPPDFDNCSASQLHSNFFVPNSPLFMCPSFPFHVCISPASSNLALLATALFITCSATRD